MTTKAELIAKLKTENPTIVLTFNGVKTTLDKVEYETTCDAWADVRLEQIAVEQAEADKAAAKTSAQAKLAALGLTTDEIAALGN